MSKNVPEFIVVHTTATPVGWMKNDSAVAKVAEIDVWHKARGWKGFGYHWLIDRDGTLAAGRKENESAAAVKERRLNFTAIHITLVGGKTSKKTDDFYTNYTEEQKVKLNQLIGDISEEYGIPLKNVMGHNEVAPKACPGFTVQDYMKDYYGRSGKVGKEGSGSGNAGSLTNPSSIMGWFRKLFRG